MPECAKAMSSSWEVTNLALHRWCHAASASCTIGVTAPSPILARRPVGVTPSSINYTGIACPDMKKVSLAIREAQQLPDCHRVIGL